MVAVLRRQAWLTAHTEYTVYDGCREAASGTEYITWYWHGMASVGRRNPHDTYMLLLTRGVRSRWEVTLRLVKNHQDLSGIA